jgi:outer membrane biosynthesis protein TonB
MDHRRRADGRVRSALAASVALHAAVVLFAVVAEGSPPKPAKTKVYAVDIVSPPPNVAGAPPMEALSNQEPGPAAAEPQPAAAEPAPPEPTPPAPDPEPAPPREESPKEPAKAPEPRRTPERPPQRPATTPVERPKSETPPRTNPPRPASNTPATNTNRPPREPEKSRPTTNRPPTSGSSSGQSGTGSGSTRTRGDGTSTAPATGSNPQANSPGGEGLNIHTEGDPCPVAGYCERVTLQVQRYFRAPPDNTGARGEVCFRIQRDGSVTDIQAQRMRGGGAAFRLAMMEAAEAAGSRRAFGTLPGAFDPQRWRWCVELTPR